MYVSRTRGLAWAYTGLLNYRLVGNGLRVELVDCLAGSEVSIEFVRDFHWADFEAISAGVAFFHVHISGMLEYPCLEPAGFSVNPEDLGISEDLHIRVLVNFHQSW
jgi:hypothetical protein